MGTPGQQVALYDKLFALQVPQVPRRNTLWTSAMWSFPAQHSVWGYSDWLVNTASWTC
jgi:hypothetical protein